MALVKDFEPELIDDLLARAVAEYPERAAVVSGAVRVSYRDLAERVARVAAALQALGIGAEDRVAILDKNSSCYLELYFALPRIGAVAVPLNYRLAPAELAYILRDSTATAWLFSAEYAGVVRALRGEVDGVRHFVCLEHALDDALGYEQLLAAAAAEPRPVPRRPDDTLLQMYTSGTTGRPKGAMLTHANMIANTLTALTERDYADGDVYLHACPLYHCADLELYYGMTYACGANVVLREFTPSAALGLIERERVSVTFLVPAMIGFILDAPDFERYDISSLRLIVYGGSAIPIERLKQALAKLPCKLSQGYGLTETSPILCVLAAEDHITEGPRARRIASCGKPARNVEVRVVDGIGAVCPSETVGEIVVRGKNVMKGYWRAPEATREALRDGWFHTGDLGYFDADGYLYIVDRKKDMIVSGGENVYPREVEEVLYQHPDVLEAAVIGVPSECWGETVKAVVVARRGTNLGSEELIAWCQARLARYKAPTSVDFVPELPRNPSGKVLKRALRERYWSGRARRVS